MNGKSDGWRKMVQVCISVYKIKCRIVFFLKNKSFFGLIILFVKDIVSGKGVVTQNAETNKVPTSVGKSLLYNKPWNKG